MAEYVVSMKLKGDEKTLDYIVKELCRLSEYEEVTAFYISEIGRYKEREREIYNREI